MVEYYLIILKCEVLIYTIACMNLENIMVKSQPQKIPYCALAGVAQWIEHWAENQRVTSLIPSQGTCLGCGPGP